MIKDNIVRYNEKYGIFIQKDSFNNIIENNTVVGNRIGIGILDGSDNNIIRNNVVKGNVADSIRIDANNTTNLEIDNEID
jgi:parallel beta-helix repeat protein